MIGEGRGGRYYGRAGGGMALREFQFLIFYFCVFFCLFLMPKSATYRI